MVSQSPNLRIISNAALDDLPNLSDHLPLTLTISIPVPDAYNPDESKNFYSPKRQLRWDKADLLQYYSDTYTRLQPVLQELLDKSFLGEGDTATHREAAILTIESTYNNLVASLASSASACIPKIATGSLKSWWSDELSRLKNEARDSQRVWSIAGKSVSGPLHSCYKQDKYKYKLAIRKARLDENQCLSASLHDAFCN